MDNKKIFEAISNQELIAEIERRGLVGEIAGSLATATEVRKPVEVDSTNLKEQIFGQLDTAYGAYSAVAEGLNDERKKKDQITLADQETLQNEFAAWFTEDKLGYVQSAMDADPNLRFTLVATPNKVASSKEIARVAEVFGKDQPYTTYIFGDLYSKYTAQELSGTNPNNDQTVQFSLIPSSYTPELSGTVKQQKAKLAKLQNASPFVKVPSVLEAVTYWHTLREQGDQLADSTAFDKTYVRHFDLDTKRVGAWQDVPDSCVADDGQPSLGGSDAEGDGSGRVAVG